MDLLGLREIMQNIKYPQIKSHYSQSSILERLVTGANFDRESSRFDNPMVVPRP